MCVFKSTTVSWSTISNPNFFKSLTNWSDFFKAFLTLFSTNSILPSNFFFIKNLPVFQFVSFVVVLPPREVPNLPSAKSAKPYMSAKKSGIPPSITHSPNIVRPLCILAARIPTLILYCSITVPKFPSIRFLGIFLIISTSALDLSE